MKYTLELEIDCPRGKVAALFEDPENLKAWQPALIGVEPLRGLPGQEGSTTLLKYRMGQSVLEMTETLLENRLPDRRVSTYETKKVWNKVENAFFETPEGRTRWVFTSEFRCGGLMRVMTVLMPWMFRKQSLKNMKQFQAYAEASGQD